MPPRTRSLFLSVCSPYVFLPLETSLPLRFFRPFILLWSRSISFSRFLRFLSISLSRTSFMLLLLNRIISLAPFRHLSHSFVHLRSCSFPLSVQLPRTPSNLIVRLFPSLWTSPRPLPPPFPPSSLVSPARTSTIAHPRHHPVTSPIALFHAPDRECALISHSLSLCLPLSFSPSLLRFSSLFIYSLTLPSFLPFAHSHLPFDMHPTPLSPSVARPKLPGGTSRSRVLAESSARNCTPPQSSIGDAFNHIDGLHNLFIKSRDRHDSVSANNQDKIPLYSSARVNS